MTPPTARAPAHTQDTQESAGTHPMHEPGPSSSLFTGPSIRRPASPPGTTHRPPHPSPLPPTSQPPPPQPPHPPHNHILVQHTTPQAAGKASTIPHRERPRCCQGPRPSETSARSPAETQDRSQATTQTRRRTTSSARYLTRAQVQARCHDNSASLTPRGCPLRPPAPASPDPAAAALNTAPSNRHRRRHHHLHWTARRGRGATHLLPPPLKARTTIPWTTPHQTRAAPGPTMSVPSPLPTSDVSPHPADAPLPPPPRIPTQPRSRDRARVPTGPRPPTPPLPPRPHGTGLQGLPRAHHRHQSP